MSSTMSKRSIDTSLSATNKNDELEQLERRKAYHIRINIEEDVSFKQLSTKLNAQLIPVTKAKTGAINGESLGIVFPIYMFNAPRIIYDFVKRIKSAKYLYIVMTMGGNSGKTTKRIKRILLKNNVHSK